VVQKKTVTTIDSAATQATAATTATAGARAAATATQQEKNPEHKTYVATASAGTADALAGWCRVSETVGEVAVDDAKLVGRASSGTL